MTGSLAVADAAPSSPSAVPAFRERVMVTDMAAVRALVRATGFFTPEEEAIAVELVEERLAKGAASGYEFLFVERGGEMLGYACFGPVPLTRSSHDLYWIAVHPAAQGAGLGRALMAAAERATAAAGGTALYAETSSRDQYAPTRRFYAMLGYAVAAEFPDFYAPGDGKVVFVKRLG
jgi:ribosomal protein S18 acetylase RimI-like enzyme